MSTIKIKGRTGFEVRFKLQGKRQTIYLAHATKAAATRFDQKLQELLAATRLGVEPSVTVAKWLQEMDAHLHEKLVAKGLAEDRPKQIATVTLNEATATFIRDFTGADSTREQLSSCFDIFANYLAKKRGKDNPLVTDIEAGDVRGFRAYQAKIKIAESTIRKRCSRNKQVFTQLVRDGDLETNPFDAVPTAAVSNPANRAMVDAAEVTELIGKLDKVELKLMLAMCRFGGLRRHEVALMNWEDIDFGTGAMTIRSHKTPPVRTCPLFSELRPLIEPYRRSAGKVQGKWHCDSNAPATVLKKDCDRLGLKLWAKPFQNLRASRETELLNKYPIVDVTGWLGNSPTVAIKHYAMSMNKNFQDAIQ